tara:strand:- start:1928 stop:2347 length:420 start_codon:yes stop_codon:yes gene_type:complete
MPYHTNEKKMMKKKSNHNMKKNPGPKSAKDFKPHKMYKGNKVVMTKTFKEHLKFKKLGYDHNKPKKSKSKMETIELNGKQVKFKEGALRRQLKLKPDEKLSKPMIKKIINKEKFKLFGRDYKMTPLLKKRLNFAMTLMK